MSIFKVLEANIEKSAEDFSSFLYDSKGDELRGAEFMFYAIYCNIFDRTPREASLIGYSLFSRARLPYLCHQQGQENKGQNSQNLNLSN